MNKIFLSNYSNVISDESIGNKIIDKIQTILDSSESVEIDFTGVITMATFCARQIFGKLYIEMGRENFKKKVLLYNANNTIKAIVSDAIMFSVEQSNNKQSL